jgi:hypothetical protein
LDADLAAQVAAHVATCADCQSLIETIHSVRAELADAGPAIFDPHPSVDDIAASIAGEDGPEPFRYARIREHIAACPTCAIEAAHLKSADPDLPRMPPEPQPADRSEVTSRGARSGPWRILVPAMAAGLVAFAWPAFRGATHLPRLEARVAELENELQKARAGAAQQRLELQAAEQREHQLRDWGGAIRTLVLPPVARGGSTPAPVLELQPGQTAQPIWVTFDPFTRQDPRGETRLQIDLFAPRNATAAWTYQATAAQLWSRDAQALSLLVPVSALQAGRNRLAVSVAGESEPRYSATFEVVPAP